MNTSSSDRESANQSAVFESAEASPFSLRLFLGLGALVLLAGGLIGNALFNYKDTEQSGYVRQLPPGEKPLVVSLPAMEAMRLAGSQVFTTCGACHQKDGMGNASFPPLGGSQWVNGNPLQVAMIVLNGLEGPITVSGKSFNSTMPAQGATLSPVQLAAIINYVRNAFGNTSKDLVSVAMAKKAIELSKKRNGGGIVGRPMRAEELTSSYQEPLDIAPLAKDARIHPVSLEPIGQ